LSILEEEKEEKKNLLVSYIANWEVEKAQKEALKVQYIDYLINKPKNILKKNVGKKEEEKSKYNQYEEDIVNWLLE
jgi:hypothetical protein